MTEQKLILKIDPHIPIPINVQIKEQIKWLIGIGMIKSGDFLPPTNQLADHLQLNRNTINWVYAQLRDEGMVSMQKGKGTQVTEGAKIEELKSRKRPLFAFVEKIVQECEEQGFDLEEVILSSFAYSQLLNHQLDENKIRILFIECREHDHTFYKSEIERLTSAEVKTLFIEDLQMQSNIDDWVMESDYVITTLNHGEEVRRLLSEKEKKILIIGATAEMSMLIDIAKLEPGSKVGFVCLGNEGGKWMAERVEDAGIDQIESITQGVDHPEELLQTIKQADKIYASPVVYNQVKELAPEKAVLFPLKLERSSETLLRELSDP